MSQAASLIVIAGPTGSGKSSLALRLAPAVNGEIVNYDSVQLYRGFDIGSAKPSAHQRTLVPHHLIDVIEPTEEIDAAAYARLAHDVCNDIHARGRRAILVGGTFFYLRALLAGLPEMPRRDERLRARLRSIAQRPTGPRRLHRFLSKIDPGSSQSIAPGDRHRVERALEVWITSGRPISSWRRPERDMIPSLKIGLAVERAHLSAVLDVRVEEMFRRGLVAETDALRRRYPVTARPFGTIGYREALALLEGRLEEAEAIAETKRRTRAYAKRQMTWLRSEQNVQWIAAEDPDATFEAAIQMIEGFN